MVFANHLVTFRILFMPDLPKTYMFIRRTLVRTPDFEEEAVSVLKKRILYFHTNLEIICSNSVKNVAGSLTGIA